MCRDCEESSVTKCTYWAIIIKQHVLSGCHSVRQSRSRRYTMAWLTERQIGSTHTLRLVYYLQKYENGKRDLIGQEHGKPKYCGIHLEHYAITSTHIIYMKQGTRPKPPSLGLAVITTPKCGTISTYRMSTGSNQYSAIIYVHYRTKVPSSSFQHRSTADWKHNTKVMLHRTTTRTSQRDDPKNSLRTGNENSNSTFNFTNPHQHNRYHLLHCNCGNVRSNNTKL